MSDFSEQLREDLARKEAAARAAAEVQATEGEAARKRSDDNVDGAAATLVRKVFQPLLEEFKEVMESEGVLHDGRLREERPTAFRAAADNRRRGRKPQTPNPKSEVPNKS